MLVSASAVPGKLGHAVTPSAGDMFAVNRKGHVQKVIYRGHFRTGERVD